MMKDKDAAKDSLIGGLKFVAKECYQSLYIHFLRSSNDPKCLQRYRNLDDQTQGRQAGFWTDS